MSILFHRWAILLALALLAAAPAVVASAEDKPSHRPNILFIAVDDLNHWVGYLGRNKQTLTPNIDQLARRGTSFTHSYCAAPICNPSRQALLSGLRPSTSGVYDNGDDGRPTIPGELSLISTFRKAGYFTAGSGKIYHGGYDRKNEWDDYLKNAGPDPKPTGNTGIGGIKFAPLDARDEELEDYKIVSYGVEQLQKKHDQPFLLTIGIHKPHMPWNVPKKYYDLHPLASIELPPTKAGDLSDIPAAGVKIAAPSGDHKDILDSGRWKEAVQGYLAAISFCDAQIGRLLAALDKSEYRDNTIIVFWGDHGWHLGEKEHWRKFALWEEATRAPLIWVVPGVTKPGSLSQRTVDFMSIYPTLTDLAGIPTPAHVEGKSIRPLLADPNAEWSTPAITTHGYNNHAVRSEGWRYIRYADGSEELYDEAKDPYEWDNLAGDPKFAAQKETLSRYLPRKNAEDLSGKTNAAGKKAGKKKSAE